MVYSVYLGGSPRLEVGGARLFKPRDEYLVLPGERFSAGPKAGAKAQFFCFAFLRTA